MNAPFKKISTWRERIGQTAEFPLHVPTDVERAMVAEIAELRGAACATTDAAWDVLAERRRQVAVEGWSLETDDGYTRRELAQAAICYLRVARSTGRLDKSAEMWPWTLDWWKPTTYRRNLIKAGALLLAEIERIDRAANKPGEPV